ncbi:hypothetical protein RvY_15426-2 [Ramazzottius varieornatus]|uniref:Uncharacterized protein n=1 Tax=Ramazzottius varieornatus TaxID=947166 RepID=A0A1D1VUX4_RAMVA|nr:hypothetical protein RvY_15426-2 [Ramazzottius varieornatus]
MGVFFSNLWNTLFETKPISILMVGLDAAGKTTILFKLKLGEVISTIPTIGFNVENVVYKNLTFTVWDVGGQFILRKLWHHYYQNAHALIFVVDCSDQTRVEEAREELFGVLEADELRNAPVLIFANKRDLPHTMSAAQLTAALHLDKLGGRQVHKKTVFVSMSCSLRKEQLS